MSAHTLTHEHHRRVRRMGRFELGWPQFWLLSGILAGMLALVAFVFLIGLFPR